MYKLIVGLSVFVSLILTGQAQAQTPAVPTFRINIVGQLPIDSNVVSNISYELFQVLYGNGNCDRCRGNPTLKHDQDPPAGQQTERDRIANLLTSKMLNIPDCRGFLSGALDAVDILQKLVEQQRILISPKYGNDGGYFLCVFAQALAPNGGSGAGIGALAKIILYPGFFGRPFPGSGCSGIYTDDQKIGAIAHELYHTTDVTHTHATQADSEKLQENIMAKCQLAGPPYQ